MSMREAVLYLRDTTMGAGSAFRSTVVRVFLSGFTVIALIWVSVMMYVSFYYAYMPTVRHTEPVYLQFSSECGNGPEHGLCTYPEANMTLSKGDRILMRGQKYQVFLDLEMPHSPVNEKLGMFMVNIKFFTLSGTVVAKTSRSAMLHFKSGLLQSIYTMCLFVPMIFGLTEEKQFVAVKLFESYVDDSYHPAVAVNVAIKAKHIEIYSASLRIEAQFTGLRYILFNWPITSALIIISANFIVISFIFFFAYTAFIPEPEDEVYSRTLQEETIETEPSPSNARRRNTSTSRETPQATRPRSPTRTGRSKAKLTHKRQRADMRSNVPSTHAQNKTSPQETRVDSGMLRSTTFPLFRWGEAADSGDSAGQSGAYSDETVHSTPGAVGRDHTGDAGRVPMGSTQDHACLGRDPLTDRGDVGDQELLEAYSGLGSTKRAHRTTVSDGETETPETISGLLQSSNPLRNSTSLSEPRPQENGACASGVTPITGLSHEREMRARETKEVYTIVDSQSGNGFRKSAMPGRTFLLGSTDTSEEEQTALYASDTKEDSKRASQRSLTSRVPDGAPSGSAPVLSGPRTNSDEARAELSNGGGTAVRKRSSKQGGRPKIGLSFRKMLSLSR